MQHRYQNLTQKIAPETENPHHLLMSSHKNFWNILKEYPIMTRLIISRRSRYFDTMAVI